MKNRVNVRTETVERYDTEVRCDRCGEVVPPRTRQFTAVEIHVDDGYSYPEGGSHTRTLTDCCADCWDEARAALEAAGFTFRDEHHDW